MISFGNLGKYQATIGAFFQKMIVSTSSSKSGSDVAYNKDSSDKEVWDKIDINDLKEANENHHSTEEMDDLVLINGKDLPHDAVHSNFSNDEDYIEIKENEDSEHSGNDGWVEINHKDGCVGSEDSSSGAKKLACDIDAKLGGHKEKNNCHGEEKLQGFGAGKAGAYKDNHSDHHGDFELGSYGHERHVNCGDKIDGYITEKNHCGYEDFKHNGYGGYADNDGKSHKKRYRISTEDVYGCRIKRSAYEHNRKSSIYNLKDPEKFHVGVDLLQWQSRRAFIQRIS